VHRTRGARGLGRRSGTAVAAVAAVATTFAAVTLLAGASGCAPARPPSVNAPIDTSPAIEALTPERSSIGLRKSVVADQYYWLRTKALEGEAPPPFSDALAAMADLRALLGSDASAWEDLEVPLGSVGGASELAGVYGALPEQEDLDGKPVPLRATALRVAHALESSERAYRASGAYREHAEAIARAATELRARLVPRADAILDAIDAEMNLPGVERPIVVTLVGEAPYPSMFAANARGTTSASFVRVRGLDGTALVETLLTEVLHAIDEKTVRAPTAMNMLRAELGRRGYDEGDPNVEMAVNTVTIAEAASLVRRFVDPAHRPLGESGFYTLYPQAPDIAAAWDRHVAGASLDETADAIARAVASPPAAPAPAP
jgi:hypothetical protein